MKNNFLDERQTAKVNSKILAIDTLISVDSMVVMLLCTLHTQDQHSETIDNRGGLLLVFRFTLLNRLIFVLRTRVTNLTIEFSHLINSTTVALNSFITDS